MVGIKAQIYKFRYQIKQMFKTFGTFVVYFVERI